jgi:hypothetical protein
MALLSSEVDFYRFPHTWRTYTHGSKIWSYDFGILILNVLEISVLSFLVLLFIDPEAGKNNSFIYFVSQVTRILGFNYSV